MAIVKNVAKNISTSEVCVKKAELFFSSCADLKDARKEAKKHACELLLACSHVAAFEIAKCEGLNKAAVAKLSSMTACAAKLEMAYDAKAKTLSVKVIDAKFNTEERKLLEKGKFPKRFKVEKEIDLDDISRRIQSLLKSLSAEDRQAVLDDVTETLSQVEQA